MHKTKHTKKEQKARFNMFLFAHSHMRTRFGGMNRRKERVPYAHPSCYAQQTQMDVHCTLARVPVVCQNTADDDDNDTLRSCHRADVRGPCPMARVLSKQTTHSPKLQAHTAATSAAAIKLPFSLKCRDVLRDLHHVKSGPKAYDGWTKTRKQYNKSGHTAAKGSDHVVL